MSDTPRTDAKWDECFATIARDTVRFREFAAQLERENNELRASNDRMFKINEGLLAENAEMETMLRDSKEVLDEYAKDGKHRAAYDASLRIYGFLRIRYNSQNK